MARVISHRTPLALHQTIAARLVRCTGSDAHSTSSPPLFEPIAGELTGIVGVESEDLDAVRASPCIVLLDGQMCIALRLQIVDLVERGKAIMKADYVAMATVNVGDACLIYVIADAAWAVDLGDVRLNWSVVCRPSHAGMPHTSPRGSVPEPATMTEVRP